MSIIQRAGATIAAGTSTTVTLNGVTAHNTLALRVNYYHPTTNNTPAVPTDSQGAVFVGRAQSSIFSNSGFSGIVQYDKLDAEAGTHTATVTLRDVGASYAEIEFDEIPTCTAADITNVSGGSASAASTTGGGTGTSATLAQANEAVFASLMMFAGTGLNPAGISTPATAGYTSQSVNQNTTTNLGAEFSYKEVSATTAVSGNWTWSADSTQLTWASLLVTYKQSVAADVLQSQSCM